MTNTTIEFPGDKLQELVDKAMNEIAQFEVKPQTIYCGDEDRVEFFKELIVALGIDKFINYEVKIVDGEYEVVIGGSDNA